MPKTKPQVRAPRRMEQPLAPVVEIYNGPDKIAEARFSGHAFHVLIEAGETRLKWVGAVQKRAAAIALARTAHTEFWHTLKEACT